MGPACFQYCMNIWLSKKKICLRWIPHNLSIAKKKKSINPSDKSALTIGSNAYKSVQSDFRWLLFLFSKKAVLVSRQVIFRICQSKAEVTKMIVSKQVQFFESLFQNDSPTKYTNALFMYTNIHDWSLQSFSQNYWPSFSHHLCCMC